MDELSDVESHASQQEQEHEQEQEHDQEQEQEQEQEPMDVEMDADAAPDEKNVTVCEVCRSSQRERDIVLCDDCDAEYHVFCLEPPLPQVPEGAWLCPKCRAKFPSSEAASGAADGVRVKAESVRAAAGGAGAAADAHTREAAPTSGSAQDRAADGPTSIPVSAPWGMLESARRVLKRARFVVVLCCCVCACAYADRAGSGGKPRLEQLAAGSCVQLRRRQVRRPGVP
ncbi:unnamed protein product [Phytophthora fragariaefolia]|uniref:Unnamed protein product n=1 Tax=Phytophthora fragariaefolia TaxID=1490495 RepID=A0A9W6XJL8_9STRA|nr:unnamed protein product [Phytophthora fragariaefolia]